MQPTDNSTGTRIIAIDGPSGIGKSKLLPIVKTILIGKGIRADTISNNGAGPFSATIRDLAVNNLTPYSLAVAVAGARAYLRESSPTELLLCDRHVLSTFVYQTFSGVPNEYLYHLNAPFLDGVLFVALELPLEELQARRLGRGRPDDDVFKRTMPISTEAQLFRVAVEILRNYGHAVRVVPADGTPETVANRIVETVSPALTKTSAGRKEHHESG